jgi:AraC-like DNA-binding protein
MVGRYQFIRAVIEGETYRAYRNALEIIPLILGVLGYVFIQISLNFKVESPLEIKGIGATSFQTVVEIPFMKLIYVLILNIDIFLTLSQGILMSEYKVLGQFADRIRKIHLFSMIGIIGRVLVYGGAIILDYTMHSMGVLLALAVLALVIIQLLLLDTDEFPKLTKEIKETATAEERTWSDLIKGLQTHQWYLDFNLKFHEVAERLDISPARLRKSIQAHSDLNFTELINVHRIDYLMDLKDQFDLNEIPIDELARRCGFKSRVTLYRATIKWLNVTPSHASDFEGKFNLHKYLIK